MCTFRFELNMLPCSERRRCDWGRHLSVRADCWICLQSPVSWSAWGGSWWGKRPRRWMRSWPSRCTSLLSPYSCRKKTREQPAWFSLRRGLQEIKMSTIRSWTGWSTARRHKLSSQWTCWWVGGCGACWGLKCSHLMGTSLYWGWPGWVLPSSGVWVTVGMDLFTNTCLFSTLSPVPHTRYITEFITVHAHIWCDCLVLILCSLFIDHL